MAEKKMTKKEFYQSLMDKYDLTDEERAKLQHEIDLLDKKNAKGKKPSATQIANEGIKGAIVEYLGTVEKPQTVTDIMKNVAECNELTNQRVSALVRQLKEAEIVTRTEAKGRAYFALANKD